MQAGALRKRITIEQRSSTVDSVGGQSSTWSTVAVVWAAIEPMKGRELLAAQQVYAEATHNVIMRYQSGITAAMRINYGGRIFNIAAVLDENERHRQLTLICSEGLNNG